MINFWVAVGLSVLSASIFIWLSVSSQMKAAEVEESNAVESGRTKLLMLLGVLILLLIPLSYYYLGNIEKQQSWERATNDLSDISDGNTSLSQQMTIQTMILGLRTAIEKDPSNGQLWFMLAEAYFQLRMIDLADLSMQRAIRIDPRPDWFVANAQILSARSNNSDMSKSVNLLQSALSIQPDHQAALLTLGFLYARQQQYEFAISVWKRLASLVEKAGNDSSAINEQIALATKRLNERTNGG